MEISIFTCMSIIKSFCPDLVIYQKYIPGNMQLLTYLCDQLNFLPSVILLVH